MQLADNWPKPFRWWIACARCLGSAARTHLVCVLLCAPALAAAQEPAPADEAVVPPGQEELLSDMLGRGATLPEGCKFTGGQADGPTIRSTYKCPSGEIVVVMVHPSTAPDGAIQTDRFAFSVQSGAPPEALTDALASLIRSREDAFEWDWLVHEDAAATDDGGDAE